MPNNNSRPGIPVVNQIVSLWLLIIASPLLAQPAAYWQMEFPTSQSGPAQQHFLEGVTSMHLHMFEDAEEHFRAAQEIAPNFAMAYWGQALNNHRIIWSIHQLEDARAVLNRLGPTPAARAAKAPTPRERAYLSAVEILFGDGSRTERQWAYAQAMEELSQDYPEDIEAKAWYALSLMRETPPDLTREQTRSLMASLSLEVLAQNSRHPGANRYLIQSTDDPVNTDLGIIAVNNLEVLELEAAEALHIPSHYYIQHGMWRETAESNMRAFESSMAWVEENGWQLEDLNNHNYGHLLRFANYGFLQSGQRERAASIRQRVLRDFIASNGAEEIATPLADVFARHVIDLERWGELANLVDLARQHELRHAALWTTIGIGSAQQGDLDLAREALRMLSDGNDGGASEATIGALQVDGMIHLAEGAIDQGLIILKQSIEVNDRMNLANPVTLIGIPPRPIKPSRELVGEVLLKLGRTEEALQQFRTGLTLYRGRVNLLRGAMTAAHASGDDELGKRYLQQLEEILETN